MGDRSVQVLQSLRVGTVFIGVQLNWAVPGQQLQKLSELPADRLWIRSTDAGFEARSSALLVVGHAPLAAQLGVGEGVQKVGVGANHQVEVAGEILAVFKGLEAVGDQGLVHGCLMAILLLEEQAVPAEPRGLAANGLWRDRQFSRNLAEPGAGDGAIKDQREEIWPFKPIGRLKGLVAE